MRGLKSGKGTRWADREKVWKRKRWRGGTSNARWSNPPVPPPGPLKNSWSRKRNKKRGTMCTMPPWWKCIVRWHSCSAKDLSSRRSRQTVLRNHQLYTFTASLTSIDFNRYSGCLISGPTILLYFNIQRTKKSAGCSQKRSQKNSLETALTYWAGRLETWIKVLWPWLTFFSLKRATIPLFYLKTTTLMNQSRCY